MAKQIDFCIICGEAPCICNGSKARPRSSPKPKKSLPSSDQVTSPEKTNSPSEPIELSLETKTERFRNRSHSPKPERDLSYESALLTIREIVSPRDQRWIDDQLARPYPQDIDRRVSEWRSRVLRRSAGSS